MTSNVRTASKNDELVDWLRIMSNERFRRLPIVDDNDRLTAVMTQGDFVSYTWPELVVQMKTMAQATFGDSLSLPRILAGVLIYSAVIIVAVGMIK